MRNANVMSVLKISCLIFSSFSFFFFHDEENVIDENEKEKKERNEKE